MNIELISLDIWNTLLKPNPDYSLKRAAAVRDVIAPALDLQEMHVRVKAASNQLGMESNRTGVQYGFEDRMNLVWENLPEEERVEGLTPGIIEKLDDAHGLIAVEYPPLLIEKDILSTLASLRDQAYHLAVVSNTGNLDGKHMRLVLDVLGVARYLDHALFSNEVGVAKPDRAIFDRLASDSNVDPSRILHVGDDLSADYLGARNAGMSSLLYSAEDRGRVERISSIRELLNLEAALC